MRPARGAEQYVTSVDGGNNITTYCLSAGRLPLGHQQDRLAGRRHLDRAIGIASDRMSAAPTCAERRTSSR